jgi:hypothetical protein
MSHASPLAPVELRTMHNEPVLVTPGKSYDNPAVGMRGSIRITPDDQVEIDLQFADMYDRPAAMRRIRLTPEQIILLRASKASYGAYALRLDGLIEPPETGPRDIGPFHPRK